MDLRVVRWRSKRSAIPGRRCRIVLERGRAWEDGVAPGPVYQTLFDVFFEDPLRQTSTLLGSVKVLQRGQAAPDLSGIERERVLPDDCCSIGQTIDYYQAVEALGKTRAREVLRRLNDVTVDPHRGREFESEPGFKESLLRFSEAALIYRRGPAALLNASGTRETFLLRFVALLEGFDEPHKVEFSFSPSDSAIGRVAAVVGPNGTGKTQLLARLAAALWGLSRPGEEVTIAPGQVGRVIVVSYSALDTFDRPPHRLSEMSRHPALDNYCYCGFRGEDGRLDPDALFAALGQDLVEITRWKRWDAWREMLEALQILPHEAHLRRALDRNDAAIVAAVRLLGAGEKTAVCVLSRLLAKLRVNAFVLFDEPELNMHPALLSRLLRVLHRWLSEFDAHAIVATHSPLVLQEVPGARVCVIDREGQVPFIRKYGGECLGASLSDIVETAFGMDDEARNYAGILQSLIDRGTTEEALEAELGRPLSLNARMAWRELQRRRVTDA